MTTKGIGHYSYTVDSFIEALGNLAEALDQRGHLYAQRKFMMDGMVDMPDEYYEARLKAETATQMVERGPLYHYPDNIKRQVCNIRLERLCGIVG